jgi:putative ABC transport system substrate-binding protein
VLEQGRQGDQMKIGKSKMKLPLRIFLFLCLLATVIVPTVSSAAQQSAKARRIGFISAAASEISAANEIIRQGLREIGYREGQNLIVEHRSAQSRPQLAEVSAELVQLKVDAIVAPGGPAARAAQEATKMIPIIFAVSGDPIEAGYIHSLARPGGNMTGLTWLSFELVGKRLELLKEAVPGVSRVAVLSNPAHPGEQRELRETQTTARALGITLAYHQARSRSDFDAAFDAITKKNVNGLLVFPEATTLGQVKHIAEFAAKQKLPSMFGWREYVEGGGLLAYGPNRRETLKRIPVYVDKILKGTKPAELPVEQPTKFEMVINLKAAKQIGLTVPANVLARADRVIR